MHARAPPPARRRSVVSPPLWWYVSVRLCESDCARARGSVSDCSSWLGGTGAGPRGLALPEAGRLLAPQDTPRQTSTLLAILLT
ncbi:hypothetical protein MTO96_012924 [Rhipicephalus appendiculatus]